MLNIEFDIQSLFGLHVYSCSHWPRPRKPPPRIWAHIRGRYWSPKLDISKLFVTLWQEGSNKERDLRSEKTTLVDLVYLIPLAPFYNSSHVPKRPMNIIK
jgi:hypothetical protein